MHAKRYSANNFRRFRRDQEMVFGHTHQDLLNFANLGLIFSTCYPSRKFPSQLLIRKLKLHLALVALSKSKNAFDSGSRQVMAAGSPCQQLAMDLNR